MRTLIPIGEVISLIERGYSVAHDSGSLVTIFKEGMTRHQVAMSHVKCKGGRFVVQQPAQNGRQEK